MFGFFTSAQWIALNGKLDAISKQLALILAMETKIMNTVDDIQADVTAEDTVIDGAVTLLQQLATALAAAGTDPAKLAALHSDITTKTAALAAAVVANTPGAPAPAAALKQAQAAVAAS